MLKRATFLPSQPWRAKRAYSQARPQATHEPEAYPLGYLEDSCETRMQLMARFSIRLKEPLRTEKERTGHPRMGHPEPNAASARIVEVLLVEQVDGIESHQ
jgi:hypothetical protein